MNSKAFIHQNAIVEAGAQIGAGTSIWAFSHILPGAVVGENCNINDYVFIENQVVIGDRVTIKCGVQLWDGTTIGDDVFIGPNATFTNDHFPRSKQHLEKYIGIEICKGASIGANATLLPGIKVGQQSMVGAGAVVTRDIPPNAVVVGNPARIVGYVSTEKKEKLKSHTTQNGLDNLSVSEATLIKIPKITDLRGDLIFAEYNQHLPFDPKRFFVIHNVPSLAVRGEHAHKKQHQFLVCLHGACSVVLDDGRNRDEVMLNRPDIGLHVPPMIWAIQYKYSQDAILLVMASDVYAADDYIRDYEGYIGMVSKR